MPHNNEAVYPLLDHSVGVPNHKYLNMYQRWELPIYLMSGTDAMREAGTKYLPQNPRESDEAYNVRLHRSFLFNVYRRTVRSLASFPFVKPIVAENVPSELEFLINDADGTGKSLTEYAHELVQDALIYGLFHTFVDFPRVDRQLTLEEQRQFRIEPYFNRISPVDLIAWRTDHLGGQHALSQIRFRETTVEFVEEFLEMEVTRVRVIEPDTFRLFEFTQIPTNDGKGVYEEGFKESESVENPLGEIPIVTDYAHFKTFMEAEPPLEDLAQMNLRHWQSSSEQNNILHVARVPILFGTGFEQGELDDLTIGSSRAVMATNPEATLQYVEHSGAAIDSGRQDLLDIENKMATLGADVLLSKSRDRQTATARKIDQSESLSQLQVILRNVESHLESAFRLAGEWKGVDASDVEISIGQDMSTPNEEANAVDDLLKVFRMDGTMSNEEVDNLSKELRRRGIIGESTELNANSPNPNEGEEDRDGLNEDENVNLD